MLENIQAQALIVDHDLHALSRQIDIPIKVVLLDMKIDYKNSQRDGLNAWYEPNDLDARSTAETQRELDEPVTFMHTSGSTGKPPFSNAQRL